MRSSSPLPSIRFAFFVSFFVRERGGRERELIWRTIFSPSDEDTAVINEEPGADGNPENQENKENENDPNKEPEKEKEASKE